MAGAAVEVVAGLRMIFWWRKPTIDRQSAINRQEGELMNISTADLSDEFGDALSYCDTPFVQYGLHKSFAGAITTVRCVEDNALLRSVLETPGRGGVVVVDGAGSTRVALLGDMMAQLAIDNGWAGVIINGAVRDARILGGMELGVKALRTNPRRGSKTGAGEKDVELTFGGATFRPGDHVLSDEDGVVVQIR
jgi:regulator of ribonuclease activity A